jgi:hypothetical protein
MQPIVVGVFYITLSQRKDESDQSASPYIPSTDKIEILEHEQNQSSILFSIQRKGKLYYLRILNHVKSESSTSLGKLWKEKLMV